MNALPTSTAGASTTRPARQRREEAMQPMKTAEERGADRVEGGGVQRRRRRRPFLALTSPLKKAAGGAVDRARDDCDR